MLEKIRYQNFQKHIDRTVELDPYLTVFSGDSGSGKSSALRGLRWLCLNRPNGSSFVRKGAVSGQVIVWVDGRKIKRTKGKAGNCHQLDGESFSAMGAGKVPEPIEKVLMVSGIHFQTQHEAMYLFSQSAGQVSQALNEIVNLSEIDDALSNINQQCRQAKAKTAAIEERYLSTQKQVEELGWVSEAIKDFRILDKKAKQAEALAIKSAQLADLVQKGKRVKEDAENANLNASEAAKGLSVIESLSQKAIRLEKKQQKLSRLIESLSRQESQLDEIQKQIRITDRELSKIKKAGCPLCGK